MGSKLFRAEQKVLTFEIDFASNPQAAVGVVNLGDLPTKFCVQSMSLASVPDKNGALLTATTTVALGEDGGGSANGYLAAVDPTDNGVNRCTGALLGASGAAVERVIPDATDGLQITTAVAAAVAGKLVVYVQGYQIA